MLKRLIRRLRGPSRPTGYPRDGWMVEYRNGRERRRRLPLTRWDRVTEGLVGVAYGLAGILGRIPFIGRPFRLENRPEK